jgi:sodium-dependent dicarboxylate transporter 2/3/5
VVWFILQISFPIELDNITDAKKEIQNQVETQGKMSKNEIMIIIILIFTIMLWVFFSGYIYFGLASTALLGAILLFMTGTITWKDVEIKVPWGIILLYGGAITLGVGLTQTGAGEWMAQLLFTYLQGNLYLVILGLIIITILLTNIMSNTGAVAVLLPIGLAIANEVEGISQLLSAMLIALSGGLAFIFVIATPGNAITYSAGYFSMRDLFKAGTIANIICIAILYLIAITYWIGFLKL